jgi:peptidoglycan/LPS O-acetylase OafA/YrhL
MRVSRIAAAAKILRNGKGGRTLFPGRADDLIAANAKLRGVPTAVSWEALALLRFFLALVVLSGHLTWFAPSSLADTLAAFGGKAAVVGFLLVSGYSIAASIEQRPEGFYRRRFLRVYPLYFSAILFAVVLEVWSGGHVRLPDERTLDSLGWITATGNLLLLQTFVVKPIAFDAPVWSLAIEVFYYALAPLFARLSRNWLLAIISISFVCYALPKHADWRFVYFVLSKFNAANYIWCWLLGFLLWRDSGRITIAYAIIGIPQIYFGPYTQGPLDAGTYVLTLIILMFAADIKLPRFLKPVADYLGDLSYPLYLLHFPAFILGYSVIMLRSPYALFLLAMIVTIGAFHLIDRFIKNGVTRFATRVINDGKISIIVGLRSRDKRLDLTG